MRQMPPLPLERKVAIIVQVLAGLAHAHEAGIVHRDIKPANIFIQEDGTVKIMDFGVARLTTASITGTGNIVGTADYMSPEQVQGAKVDGRSDLFSVGCLLFELLAGRRPFHAESLMAIFYKITHEERGLRPDPARARARRACCRCCARRCAQAGGRALPDGARVRQGPARLAADARARDGRAGRRSTKAGRARRSWTARRS